MNIGFIIYNNGTYGGAEKRIPRIINWLADNSEYSIFLYLSNRLHLWINSIGISLSDKINVTLYDDMKNIHKNNYDDGCAQQRVVEIVPGQKNMIKAIIPTKVKYLKNLYSKHRLFRKWIKKNQIKIVHGWHGAGDAMLPLRFFCRVKLIYSIVDVYATMGIPLKWLGNFSYKSVFKFAHKVDFLSEYYLKRYENKGAKIPLKKVSFSNSSFIDYTKSFIDKKKPIVAFAAARFEKKKNAPLVIESANILLNQYRCKAKFILMGGKGEKTTVEKMIEKYNLKNSISIRFEKKVESILSKSLIFLSLQDYSNFPSQALLEAMACGCAVIATDVGETRKLVDDEVGFLVNKDSLEIADKIKFLLENKDIAIEMGRKAREKVLREQTIEKYGNYLLGIYRSLSQ